MVEEPALSCDAVFLLCVNGIGGAELSMLRIAEGLERSGLKVGLVLYGRETLLLQRRTRMPTVIIPQTRTMNIIRPLMRLIRSGYAKCLISALPHTNIMALMAAKLSGSAMPIIVTEHCSLAATAANGFLLRRLIAWLYPTAQYLVTVSYALQEEFQKLAPRARLRTIYNPVIDARPVVAEPLPHPWLAQKDMPVIMAAGRLAPQKGFDDLLAAFAQLRSMHNARLVILGEGECREALTAQAQSLEISNDVLMPGFVEQVPQWLRHGSLFVSSSRYEGLCNVIVEALHAGLPVVATDCPVGPAEILKQGMLGRLVKPGDTRALALAMRDALTTPHDPEPGFARARDFTAADAVNAYRNLLQAV